METDKTCLEQTNQLNLETKIRNLRAEGKTYREISKILLVSIAQISRVLNEPKQKEENAPMQQGEVASKVFSLLEKKMPLSQIVIKLKLEPEVVKDLHGKWVDLNQTDANLPNLEIVNQKLESHISDHHTLDHLLENAQTLGLNRKNNCTHIDLKNKNSCSIYTNKSMDDENFALHCVFCNYFHSRQSVIPIRNSNDPI